jgi:hypothetical protein
MVRRRACGASARQPSHESEGARWFTEPKLAYGERRLVAQIFPSWNRVSDWLTDAEGYAAVA